MRTLRPYRLFLILLAAISAAGLLCGTFWDLQISDALYHHNQPICMLLEALCFFPIYLPLALLPALLSVHGKNRKLRGFGHLLAGIVLLPFSPSVHPTCESVESGQMPPRLCAVSSSCFQVFSWKQFYIPA